MKIVCVHWGDKYPEEYVYKLKSMVERHSDAEFLCLTDKPKDCDYQILEEGFDGWWNKIQLFKEILIGLVFAVVGVLLVIFVSFVMELLLIAIFGNEIVSGIAGAPGELDVIITSSDMRQ